MGFTLYYTVGGGTPPYNIQLVGGNVEDNIHSNDGTFSFLNVDAGSYQVISKDSNGCVVSKSVVLTSTPPIELPPACDLTSFHATSNSSADGQSTGSITIESVTGEVGELTYSIDGVLWQFSNNFINLPADIYTVYVNDNIVQGCVLTGFTEVLTQAENLPYTIEFANIEVRSGGGDILNDGTEQNPYDSGVVFDFNVKGNGGIGGEFPSVYSINVRQVTFNSNSIGVNYIHGNYSNGYVFFLDSDNQDEPRGKLINNTELHEFSGGMGCLNTNQSVRFFNEPREGAVFIELMLYLNGTFVDSFGKWISGDGETPQTC